MCPSVTGPLPESGRGLWAIPRVLSCEKSQAAGNWEAGHLPPSIDFFHTFPAREGGGPIEIIPPGGETVMEKKRLLEGEETHICQVGVVVKGPRSDHRAFDLLGAGTF